MSRCRQCRDTGLVTVYHPEDVVFVRREGRSQLDTGYPRRQFCAIPCSCPLGNKFVNSRDHTGNITRQHARFGSLWWHVTPNRDRGKDNPLLYDIVADVNEQIDTSGEDNPFNRALQETDGE